MGVVRAWDNQIRVPPRSVEQLYMQGAHTSPAYVASLAAWLSQHFRMTGKTSVSIPDLQKYSNVDPDPWSPYEVTHLGHGPMAREGYIPWQEGAVYHPMSFEQQKKQYK